MIRIKIAMAWAALQVLFLGAWAGYEEMRLAPGSGQSVLVRVEPVDPRDLLRGQFMRLGYAFSRIEDARDTGRRPADGETVWRVLKREGGLHVPDGLFRERPEGLAPGAVAMEGRVDRWTLRFGVEEYFVPEGTPTPDIHELTARLRIGKDGRARIEKVYRNGTPWP
jgi:uncharacterized membrane-anchored protein